MLDDQATIRQYDRQDALAVAAAMWQQATWSAMVTHPDHDGRAIDRVVVSGMGGSALAALLVRAWLVADLRVPFEVVRGYDLPGYVDEQTLVIASSYSGNTEETVAALAQARQRGAQVAVMAAGGVLWDQAVSGRIPAVQLPAGLQPRMTLLYGLRALTALLAHFGVTDSNPYQQLAATAPWLEQQTKAWLPAVPTEDNYAKQLALAGLGKSAVIYGGALTAPLAYKWKISWNENAKNLAFCNQLPEMNHNEFMGWTSHPVDKPFVVYDLVSPGEHPRILKRFAATDRLLSGQRPAATTVRLAGKTPIEQLLWGAILADFASLYLAILNGVDPTPVALIERLKHTLADLGT